MCYIGKNSNISQCGHYFICELRQISMDGLNPSISALHVQNGQSGLNSKANFKGTIYGHTAFILEAKPIFGISLTYAFIWYRSCVVKLRSYGYRKPDQWFLDQMLLARWWCFLGIGKQFLKEKEIKSRESGFRTHNFLYLLLLKNSES